MKADVTELVVPVQKLFLVHREVLVGRSGQVETCIQSSVGSLIWSGEADPKYRQIA